MGLRGLVDSPMDQSENLELLARVERQLRVHRSSDNNNNNSDLNDSLSFSSDSPSRETARELWTLVLDVVFAPLWLRIRAAELLGVCCVVLDDDAPVRITANETHKLRAVVSSTCQALEELKATDAAQAAQLFAWLGFLERVLLATRSDVCAAVFRLGSMYAGMLTKLLRLLSSCSTKVFAAATVCLGLFHAHEKRSGRSVLVGEVLHDMKDGREHLSGALLHVINSCGCPCPQERLVHLWNALQLFGDILADETAAALVFLNDFKVLVDLVIRESTDLPQEDVSRLHYMELLERALDSPVYLQSQMYRKRELLEVLESLLDVGAEEDSVMPKDVMDKIKQILMKANYGKVSDKLRILRLMRRWMGEADETHNYPQSLMADNREPSYPQQVELRGFERAVTMAAGISMKIVHSMFVAGAVDTLVQFLPEALTRTFNMHPRMRALQVKGEDFLAEIQAPLTVDKISSKNLLRTRWFSHPESTGGAFSDWQQYAEEECNIAIDRYTQYPFFLVVWVDYNCADQARLMLFSDHYMSDGYSGMVVLNSIFDQVAHLSRGQNHSASVREFPLRASFYDNALSNISDQHDFVMPPVANPTSASFTEGDPACMRKTLARCKAENVTFAGALVSATVLAFYRAAKSQPEFDPAQPFKMMVDLDYNMRRRVPQPAEEDHVGAFISFADLEWLADAEDLNIRNSLNSDANISNVGRYPYAREFLLSGSTDKKCLLTVKSLHVYNPIPYLGASSIFFVSSVESFCYSMGHKCEDEVAKLLFATWVAICESMGDIEADEKLENVLERMHLL
ncbi:hypothetical protein PF003_g15487 [Phytophthora fragariae]|nr:hypothetical protein PF003_g15487 [Phytophthora fragariae]